MGSIRRQLATFAAVLSVLYAGGFIAGQFIEDDEPRENQHSAPARDH